MHISCSMQGQKLMMMGTADEIVKAPEKGPMFAEDMPEEKLVVNVVRLFILIRGFTWDENLAALSKSLGCKKIL